MKNIIKITLLMVVSLAVLSACDSNSEITSPAAQNFSAEQSYYVSHSDNSPDYRGGVSYPLISDDNFEIGYIFVTNDAKNMYVSYYMLDSWQMRNSYLHVGKEVNDIPQDMNGVPEPKSFRYINEPGRGLVTYMQKVPLSEIGVRLGDNVLLASLVKVIKMDEQGKVAFTDNLWVGDHPAPGNNWWSYFGYVLRDDTTGNSDATAMIEQGFFGSGSEK